MGQISGPSFPSISLFFKVVPKLQSMMIQTQCVPDDAANSNNDVTTTCASAVANNSLNSSLDNDMHTTAAEDASNSANSLADVSNTANTSSSVRNALVEDTTNKTNAEVDTDNAVNAVNVLAGPNNSVAKAVDMDNTAKAYNPEESSCALWRLIQPTYPSLAPAACR
jgi:hypothetical protein